MLYKLRTSTEGNLDYNYLKAIHRHFFSKIYPWAGEERTIGIAKGGSYFAHTGYAVNGFIHDYAYDEYQELMITIGR